jgi:beta-glucanase (GH16 family)
MDDELYHTFTPANTAGQPYPFNQPFFFVFNVAVGGNLPGSPDANTRFPQQMIVDYVRVFQR